VHRIALDAYSLEETSDYISQRLEAACETALLDEDHTAADSPSAVAAGLDRHRTPLPANDGRGNGRTAASLRALSAGVVACALDYLLVLLVAAGIGWLGWSGAQGRAGNLRASRLQLRGASSTVNRNRTPVGRAGPI